MGNVFCLDVGGERSYWTTEGGAVQWFRVAYAADKQVTWGERGLLTAYVDNEIVVGTVAEVESPY